MNKFSDFNVTTTFLVGDKIKIEDVLNVVIELHAFKIVDSKHPKEGYEKCLHLQIKTDSRERVLFTSSIVLIEQIKQIPKDGFPFKARIVRSGKSYQFTD